MAMLAFTLTPALKRKRQVDLCKSQTNMQRDSRQPGVHSVTLPQNKNEELIKSPIMNLSSTMSEWKVQFFITLT